MKLKICGMKYPENIVEASLLQPDYFGFIFWQKSSRYFDGSMPNLPASIKKIGVFVNATLEEIKTKQETYSLDYIQLHGEESPAFCKKVKEDGIKIIKAFSIDASFSFNQLNDYESTCDYFLFDTKGKLPGGNGFRFDWSLLQNANLNLPIFLSGGISIDNLLQIKELELPIHAIDINSKFELQPGLKDIHLIKEFKNKMNLIYSKNIK